MITNNPNTLDPRTAQLARSFESAQSSYDKALARYQIAADNKDEAAMFAEQENMKRASRIMTMISEMATSMHNLLTKLIEKLNVRV